MREIFPSYLQFHFFNAEYAALHSRVHQNNAENMFWEK